MLTWAALAASTWIAFTPCGFTGPHEEPYTFALAPNLTHVMLRRSRIDAVVEVRSSGELKCTILVVGADTYIVVGTFKEIVRRIRGESAQADRPD